MANKPNPANFTPEVPDFPSVPKFLPCYGKFDLTTYIQGASDYEIMCNLVQLYNTMSKGYADVEKLSTDTQKAYVQLQNFVNTWFNDLDVMEEVNVILHRMVEDGSLAQAVAQSNAIPPAVAQYLNSSEGTQNLSNVTATKIDTMAQDGSLANVVSQTGQVAPATKEFLNTSEGIAQITPPINSSVRQWLDDHPEATTTVQDGAITELKINSMFLPYIKNGYVTPEMFGAVGNGVKDDTLAVQNAIDSGGLVLASNKYKLSSTIKINVQNTLLLIGDFTYSGTDCAFWIHNSQKANKVVFGRINSNGNCINLMPDTDTDYIQYLNLHFNNLIAPTENDNACIYIRSNGRWVTETNIFGGRFKNGTYGIHAICDTGEVEHIKLYNCGFELTNYGSHIEKVNAFSLINCRYSENAHILTTIGICDNVNIYSSEFIKLEKLILSKRTTGFIVGATISDNNDFSASKFSIINNGNIFICNSAKYNNVNNLVENEQVDFSTAYPTARDLPTVINVPISAKTIILSDQYGSEFGINKIMIAANETQSRTLTIKKGNNVIAILDKEIPNYSNVILEWFPQYGWSYRIATMAKTE